MPLYLSSSNRIEKLQAQLAWLLLDQPLRDPFKSELVLVPGMAMQRWLNLRLATGHGIAANVAYPLPAAWIWALAAQALGEDETGTSQAVDPLSREQAAWRTFALLPALLARPGFEPLGHYLRNDDAGVKRWQLAQRIADVFDRYQYYRPDWIRAWSQGDDTAAIRNDEVPAWQPVLWRELISTCPNGHRVAMIDRLVSLLQSGKATPSLNGILPQRVCCFALSSLPPLFVQVLGALARHTDIFLFQHSPTDQYWADLQSEKAKARKRVESPDEVQYYDTGNELLASWGRQGQAFQDLLLNTGAFEAVHWEDYAAPEEPEDSLLHRLQNDILALDEGVTTAREDGSVSVSICHSPMRECQVLHDSLLVALQHDSTLKPEDILVMVPEISRYAPYIEAVFRRDEAGAKPFIPWNLSDISVADEHPLVRTFLTLLSLPHLRFHHSEVMGLLEIPEIARQFSLEGPALEIASELLQQSEVRWGIDGAHKKELNLPETEQNTWHHALDRLMAGYALSDTSLWHGIAPVQDVSGAHAVVVGRLCEFVATLVRWRERLSAPRSAIEWQMSLNRMLADIFGQSRDEDDKLQQIREVITELKEQAGVLEITPELLSRWLTDNLGSRAANSRFFTGGVTFCGMRPMRSLPFRIICLLGMNDQAFPRRENSVAFDAMAHRWRAGDPRKGDEDRYLFLETLLCARDKIYFSYTGRSLKDNTPCQPSVLLQELLDFIAERYGLTSDLLTRVYPMQPFSWRNYVEEENASAMRSHDSWWSGIAQEIRTRPVDTNMSPATGWPRTPLALADDLPGAIELERLIRFLQHPVKFFFNARMRLFISEAVEDEDEEVFSLDGLQSWKIRGELLTTLLQSEPEQPVTQDARTAMLQLLDARGQLPHGALAQTAYDEIDSNAQHLLDQLQIYQSVQREQHSVDLVLEPESAAMEKRLTGQIISCYPGIGLLHYTPSSLKGKTLIRAWVEHLALCADGALAQHECTRLICRDATLVFPVLSAEDARGQLRLYYGLYQEGMIRPLPIFPDASFAFAQAEDAGKGMSAACRKWFGDDYRNYPGDRDDVYVRLVTRDCDNDPLQEQEFQELAHSLYDLALHSRAKE